jgi:hypothetical protein
MSSDESAATTYVCPPSANTHVGVRQGTPVLIQYFNVLIDDGVEELQEKMHTLLLRKYKLELPIVCR